MKRVSIFVFFCIYNFSSLTYAQTLSECIDYAKNHSLMVKVSDMQAQRTKRMEGSYFEIDKTELSLSQDPTSGGSPDNALTLSQSIDFPTVYTSRKKLLRAETKVEEARTALTISELSREVSSLYCTLLLHHHEVELLQKNDSLLNEFVHIANVRYKNGETNKLEVMNAERMKAENMLQLKTAQNEEHSAALSLQTLMNSDKPVTPLYEYRPTSLTIADVQTTSFVSTPEGMLLTAEQERAKRELNYIKQGYMPSFNLGVRHQLVFSGLNPYNVDRSRFEKGNWMGFEVGIALPLFFGSQKAKTAVAKYDIDIANARQKEAQQKADTEMIIAQNACLVAEQNYMQYQNSTLPAAQEIRRLSLLEYQAGEITYVEHIQNLTSALETELASAQAADALNQAIIKAKYITGK